MLRGHEKWVQSISVTLKSDRPYEGMDLTGATGITDAQKAVLKALGAEGY